jgi:hypothetical protein
MKMKMVEKEKEKSGHDSFHEPGLFMSDLLGMILMDTLFMITEHIFFLGVKIILRLRLELQLLLLQILLLSMKWEHFSHMKH